MRTKKAKKLLSVILGTSFLLTIDNYAYAENIDNKLSVLSEEKLASESPALILENVAKDKVLNAEQYKQKTALELAEMVRTNQITSKELVELAYQVIDEENPKLNAVITTRKEQAVKEAEELVDSGQPFLGVPMLLKGLGHTVSGGENTNGLMTNKDKALSKSDGSYAKKYKELGFILLGQTNYPELGLRNITTSELYKEAGNALNLNYNAGGSSGGSASAVGSGMVSIASASDAGGSIRIPAAWNGLIGLKTSRGMVDNVNKDKFSPVAHFPITKSVADTVALFDALKKQEEGYDNVEVENIKDLTVAYTLQSPMGTEVSEDAKKAVLQSVQFLKDQGFNVVEVDNPIDGRALMNDYTALSILNGGTAGNLERDFKKLGLTKENVDPLVWALYVANKGYTRAELTAMSEQSLKNADNYKAIMEEFHKKYPIFLTPTNAEVAPLLKESLIDDKDRVDLLNIENIAKEDRFSLLVRQWEPMLRKTPFTQIANITGEPALSLPTYITENNLALGVMFNGVWGMDKTLLKIAKLFEDNSMLKISSKILPAKITTKKGESLLNEDVELPTLDISVGDENLKNELPTLDISVGDENLKNELPTLDISVGDENLKNDLPKLDLVNSNLKTSNGNADKISSSKQKLPNTGLNKPSNSYTLLTIAGVLALLTLRKKILK